MNSAGFICLHRGDATYSLLGDLPAYGLLSLICLRARWRPDPSPEGLRQGEARIGADDVQQHLGLSRKQYRGALARLVAQGHITVIPVKGLGTVARLGPKCVFSTEVRKRANSGANSGAITFPSQKTHEGADIGADLGAAQGPLRNNETMDRVQNPGPKPPGFESRGKRTKRERPQAADSLSDVNAWISEVQAMPEFQRRIDIEEIAQRCPPRNASHLAHLVRIERHPRIRPKQAPKSKAGFDEPKGWREFLLGLPAEDWRRDYADRTWLTLPAALMEQLSQPSHAA